MNVIEVANVSAEFPVSHPIFIAQPWLTSHPWLTFTLDLSHLPPSTWAELGECSSKIEHISGVPLRPDTARALNQTFLVKGVRATTAIEGNTLSEEEVKKRIEGTLKLPKSQEYLGIEIDNIEEAYLYLIKQIMEGAPLHIGPDDLCLLNEMVLKHLELPDYVVPGKYRETVVTVADYRAPSPEYNDALVARLCHWMNEPMWRRPVGARFVLPILRAIVAHLYLAWIHPFGDGNGRTARLVEFDILTRAGVPTVSAHLLSDHYNRTRTLYYRALSSARKDPINFILYAVQGLAEGLRSQLVLIRNQLMSVVWINYVHQIFRGLPRSQANDRRRDLAIELSQHAEPVPIAMVQSLSAKMADHYAQVTDRAFKRDLGELERLGLVIEEDGKLSIYIAAIQAFLPLVNPKRDEEEEAFQRKEIREGRTPISTASTVPTGSP
jgi:Fic family protein